MARKRGNNTRSRKGGNNKRSAIRQPNVQLSRMINVFRNKTIRVITLNSQTAAGTVTTTYSLSAGSDVRFLAFSAVMGSVEAQRMQTGYDTYRIIAASVMAIPNKPVTALAAYPALCVDIGPAETSPANPTNTTISSSDTCKIFSPNANSIETCTWPLSKVGLGVNILQDTDNPSTVGTFYIGNSTSMGINVTTIVWELRFQLVVEYSTDK